MCGARKPNLMLYWLLFHITIWQCCWTMAAHAGGGHPSPNPAHHTQPSAHYGPSHAHSDKHSDTYRDNSVNAPQHMTASSSIKQQVANPTTGGNSYSTPTLTTPLSNTNPDQVMNNLRLVISNSRSGQQSLASLRFDGIDEIDNDGGDDGIGGGSDSYVYGGNSLSKHLAALDEIKNTVLEQPHHHHHQPQFTVDLSLSQSSLSTSLDSIDARGLPNRVPADAVDKFTGDYGGEEFDDERIFYDIVDSKNLIRLSGARNQLARQYHRSLLDEAQHQMQQEPHHRSPLAAIGRSVTKLAKSQASSTFSGGSSVGGANHGIAPDGSCHADDLDCFGTVHDRLEMEAIRELHGQLDDDDNGNIDIVESDDFLREELKYDSGYEKRHRAFHFNDDMHISVKELWEAWLRSEVHNWTSEQTTEWLAQSVQLPQYVELFKQHKVTGATLPRLAVNNMHYVSNVLGIKDPIHKQKIALKAMDVVLFGPPRETGTRWKDYILVTLLLSVIFGCWYGYQQNKNSKTHLRRMAKDMEGLQKAETALLEMQKELERARLEQENVATEKMDLERRLKETPSLSSSSSDLEVQQLKQEIEVLRRELSRAEIELVDHCWSPPQGLQTWMQLTYELESKNHQVKRRLAEKQLLAAREACEKLKRKRTSLVGAFVSTHGKSIDDVDRSIVEARNALSEVTNELQERMHRWKQIEQILGFNIVNNNGIAYLESILYSRNGGINGKGSRALRMSSSQDDLDDESGCGVRLVESVDRVLVEDSSASEEGGDVGSIQNGVKFTVGSGTPPTTVGGTQPLSQQSLQMFNSMAGKPSSSIAMAIYQNRMQTADSLSSLSSSIFDDNRSVQSLDRAMPLPIRATTKKGTVTPPLMPAMPPPPYQAIGRTPMPPPRKALAAINRSQSADLVSMESPLPTTMLAPSSAPITSATSQGNRLVHQLSTTSTSTSSNESTTTAGSGLPQIDNGTKAVRIDTPPSTDSSIVDDELKKPKRKLHFSFGKKSSNKSKSSVK